MLLSFSILIALIMKFSLGHEMQEDCPTLKKISVYYKLCLANNQQHKHPIFCTIVIFHWQFVQFSSVYQN